jgi:hypothetical protein
MVDYIALIFVGGTVMVFTHHQVFFWLKFHRCSVKAEHQDEGEAEAAEATETKARAGVLTRHMKVQPRNVKISPPNLQVLLTKLGVSVGN